MLVYLLPLNQTMKTASVLNLIYSLLSPKYLHAYIYMHAQCRVTAFSRAAAAKQTQSTSSKTILAPFNNKNSLNTFDKAEAMLFGAH